MKHNRTEGGGRWTAQLLNPSSLGCQFATFSRLTISLIAAGLCLSARVDAAEATHPAYVPPAPLINSGSVAQIVISLLLVLAAIIAVAWLLKRINVARQGAGNLLKVLGGVSVGQRERVVLIEVLNSWLVVGVGPGQIRTLHVLDKPVVNSQYRDEENDNEQAKEGKFSALLATVLKPQSVNKKNDAS